MEQGGRESVCGRCTQTASELDGNTYQYEKLPDDVQTYRPTTVDRIYFSWSREISGPEPREKVETEFAALRQALLSMASDYVSNARRS